MVAGCNPQCGGTRKRRRKRKRRTRHKKRHKRAVNAVPAEDGGAVLDVCAAVMPSLEAAYLVRQATPLLMEEIGKMRIRQLMRVMMRVGQEIVSIIIIILPEKAAPSPITDKGVTPPPPLTKINTPNNKAQCGGKRRRQTATQKALNLKL